MKDLQAALRAAVRALVSIRHEARWTYEQGKTLDLAIEQGARALGEAAP
jgi:hypothetical protein